MRAARLGGEANVLLAWEGVNEDVEIGPCEHWKVLVVATRKIMSFEPLIRAASLEEQFALHQSLDYARRASLIALPAQRTLRIKHKLLPTCPICDIPMLPSTVPLHIPTSM